MKKITIAMSLLMIVPFLVGAQRSIADANPIQTSIDNPGKKSSRNLMAQLRAEKDFMRTHKQVENIVWYDDPAGYFIYYTRDSNRGRSFYNKKGKFVYDAISYPEKYLSPFLKDWVKSVYYYDYKITNVNEIHVQDHQVVYFVQLTDGKTWKKLKIQNDVMELVENYRCR